MDYKIIAKAWVNDLDQPFAKEVCLQFGLIEPEENDQLASLDVKDLIKTPVVEQITERYKQYLGAAKMFLPNTVENAKFKLQADVCAEILKDVFKLDSSDLERIKASVK